MSIHRARENWFELVGVTWIGCAGLAPFEFELMLDPDRDDYFSRYIFRFGQVDENGEPIVVQPQGRRGQPIHWPRRNRNWAMAVELTPPRWTARDSIP